MKNSSVVLVNSSCDSETLKECFDKMCELSEGELWVTIEFIHGSNSFWVPTPDEELEDDPYEVYGIIEIGDDQHLFKKITSLAHEVGHALHKRHNNFSNVRDTMFSESLAWFLGYNWFHDRDIVIDMEEYREHMSVALELYIAELK